MRFHLYDFNFTDDIRLIAREDGLISVNNALTVDFGGQVASESIAHRMHSGTGGQTVFPVGPSLAGGKAKIVLPSLSIMAAPRGLPALTPSLAAHPPAPPPLPPPAHPHPPPH